jgi:putative FmdB family regulatory protein
MPTYEYRCRECGHEMEAFQSMSADALTDCPACNEPELQRLISKGAGMIFKGSGFYQTDYKSSGAPKTESDAPKNEAKTEAPKSGGCGGGCACH